MKTVRFCNVKPVSNVRLSHPVLHRQHPLTIGSLALMGVLLIGCSPSVPVGPSQATPSSSPVSSNQPAGMGQMLPISAQVTVGQQVIQLEVAQTAQQQATGLMYRTELAADRGMLFPFMPPRPVAFWMKNMSITLDMVFLRDGKVTAISSNVPPCTADPFPVYGPNMPVDQVIELRGGRAAELGLKVDDRLVVQYR